MAANHFALTGGWTEVTLLTLPCRCLRELGEAVMVLYRQHFLICICRADWSDCQSRHNDDVETTIFRKYYLMVKWFCMFSTTGFELELLVWPKRTKPTLLNMYLFISLIRVLRRTQEYFIYTTPPALSWQETAQWPGEPMTLCKQTFPPTAGEEASLSWTPTHTNRIWPTPGSWHCGIALTGWGMALSTVYNKHPCKSLYFSFDVNRDDRTAPRLLTHCALLAGGIPCYTGKFVSKLLKTRLMGCFQSMCKTGHHFKCTTCIKI